MTKELISIIKKKAEQRKKGKIKSIFFSSGNFESEIKPNTGDIEVYDNKMEKLLIHKYKNKWKEEYVYLSRGENNSIHLNFRRYMVKGPILFSADIIQPDKKNYEQLKLYLESAGLWRKIK